jgi:hypothetical protein
MHSTFEARLLVWQLDTIYHTGLMMEILMFRDFIAVVELIVTINGVKYGQIMQRYRTCFWINTDKLIKLNIIKSCIRAAE